MLAVYPTSTTHIFQLRQIFHGTNSTSTSLSVSEGDKKAYDEGEGALYLESMADLKTPLPSSNLKTSETECSGTTSIKLSTNESLSHLPLSLQLYARKHRYFRECLESPESDSCSSPLLHDFQRSVIVWDRPPYRTCCGIGDRISSITFIFALAVASNRPFFISWGDEYTPFPLELTLSPSAVDWRLPESLNSAKSQLKLHNWAHKFNNTVNIESVLSMDGNRRSLLTDDLNKILGEAPVIRLYSRFSLIRRARLFRSNSLVRSSLPDLAELSKNPLLMSRVMFQVLFKISPLVAKRALDLTPKTAFLGAHIRTGSDAKENIDRFSWVANRTSYDMATAALECTLQLSHDWIPKTVSQGREVYPRDSVFIASDSVQVKLAALRYSKIKNVVVHTLLRKSVHFWAPSPAISQNQTTYSQDINSERIPLQSSPANKTNSDDTVCSTYLDIFTDVAILAQSNAFITTGSRFSDLAFFLSREAPMFKINMHESSSTKCSMSRVTGWTGY